MARQFRTDDTSTWNDGFGNGSDGAYDPSTGTDAPIDSSCSGTSGATSLSATNASFSAGQLILIHQTRGTGAGNWELNKIASYVAGTITLTYALTNTYTDSGASQAQVMVLKQYSSATIQSGRTITGKAWDGNVGGIYGFFCNGDTTIVGTLTLKGKGYLGATIDFTSGEGDPAAANVNANNPNGSGGGRGGGWSDGDGYRAAGGGGGGNGTAGTHGDPGTNNAGWGSGGNSVGVAALTTALFGGGGGIGGHHNNSSKLGGAGGDGGGLVFIFSKRITISGSVDARGNNGSNSPQLETGGGGAGAGGSVLFKGQTIVLGSNLVVAGGGTGGTASPGFDGAGGVSGVGRIHADYSNSISGTTSPTLDSAQDSSLVDRGGAWFGF